MRSRMAKNELIGTDISEDRKTQSRRIFSDLRVISVFCRTMKHTSRRAMESEQEECSIVSLESSFPCIEMIESIETIEPSELSSSSSSSSFSLDIATVQNATLKHGLTTRPEKGNNMIHDVSAIRSESDDPSSEEQNGKENREEMQGNAAEVVREYPKIFFFDRQRNRGQNFPSNTVRTTKYRWWSFIFVFLFLHGAHSPLGRSRMKQAPLHSQYQQIPFPLI